MDTAGLLVLAQSSEWSDRRSAVKALTAAAGSDADVVHCLVDALDDENTAVGEAAAVALILGAGEKGLEAVLIGISALDDQVGSWLIAGLENLWIEGSWVPDATRRFLETSDDAALRDGAEQVIDYLHEPFPVELDRGPWYGIGDEDVPGRSDPSD